MDIRSGSGNKNNRRCEFELPKEIIQHVQSFLNGREAARSSLLSKSWYNAWFTRPILDFSHLGEIICSRGDKGAEIENYIQKTMNRYKDLNLKLEKLVMDIAVPLISSDIINTLIEDASTLSVNEFSLFCHSHYFPGQVFQIRSLTKLLIGGHSEIDRLDNGRVLCSRLIGGHSEIDRLDNGRVLCSRLVSLHLCGLKILGDTIIDILLACPLIENLDLSRLSVPWCHLLTNGKNVHKLTNDRVLCPHLTSLRLHRVFIREFDVIEYIIVGSPLIEYLDFVGGYVSRRDIILPAHVFALKSTITRLSVTHCLIQFDDDRLLSSSSSSNIVSLHLNSVELGDNVIQYIFSACPLMENLEMDQCIGMSNINVSNLHNLVSLCIKGCSYRTTFYEVSFESISVPEFHKLHSLSLEYVIVDSDFFTKFSSRFPCIEDLKLDHCNGYETIQISSHSLKYLKLYQRNKLLKAEFDVPSIRKFVFNATYDDYIPSLSFRTASREWDSEVTLSCSLTFIESSWFVRLRDFLLQDLRLSRVSLKFLLQNRTVTYVNYFPCSPTLVVENIMINMDCVSEAFFCALFRCCRPTFITLQDCLDSYTYCCAKILYELYMTNKKTTNNVNRFNMIQSLLIYDLEEIDVLLGDETVPLRKFVEESPVFRQIPVRFQFKWGSFRCI